MDNQLPFEGEIVNLNDSMQMRIREVYLGKWKIQLWKWVKWAQDGEFHPTGKEGFTVDKEMFKREILPKLIELCNH